MPSVRENFLSRFDGAIRPAIIEYGKRLTAASKRADLLLLMARKAVCLAECLEALKLAHFYCPVISDRLLDTNLSWLTGKTIALFDDALISGTSLYGAVERLKQAGVASDRISTNVLCVDNTWHSKDLVDPDPPYLELSDRDSASLCARIVEGISLVPRPYAVDYPLYRNLRITRRDLEAITSLDHWVADEVTTPLQAAHDVFSITFTPDCEARSRLDDSLGWPVGDHSLSKIRMYGRKAGKDRAFYICAMFPVVAMEPISLDGIGQLSESAAAHTGDKKLIAHWLKGSKRSGKAATRALAAAQMRFVSFIAAFRLARLWFDHAASVCSSSFDQTDDRRIYDYLFPPAIIGPVQELSRSNDGLFRYASRLHSGGGIPDIAGGFHQTKPIPDQTTIEKDLTAPFLRLYEEKEIGARRLALQYGRRVFKKPEYRHIMGRLLIGFTLPNIRRWIEPLSNTVRTDILASLFLDRAIDRGSVVPITSVRGEKVFRAYRHGEDVEFGEAEERLCLTMLAAVTRASSRTDLPRIWVEKSLVLLIRLGLDQQIFNAWEHTLGDFQSMGIRYSLHGAVVGTGSDKIYHTIEYYGLTELMRRHGYLSTGQSPRSWKVNNLPEGGVHPDRAIKVTMIGSLLGTLLGDHTKKTPAHLSDDELTLVATCLYPKDLAGALAAEIDAAARDWVHRPFLNPQQDISQTSGDDAEELCLALRRSIAFFAVSNGIWKANNSRSQVPWQIIQRVGGGLGDPVYRAAWDSLWPSTGRQGQRSIPKNLVDLISREHVWLLQFKSVLLMLECAIRVRAVNASQSENVSKRIRNRRIGQFKKAQNELSTIRPDLSDAGASPKLHKAIDRLQNAVRDNQLNLGGVRDFAVQQLNWLVNDARSILSEVDAIAATFGRAEDLVYYHNALHIDITGIRDGLGNPWIEVVEPAYREIRAEAHKNNANAVIVKIERSQCAVVSGMWLVANGPFSRVWLLRIALRLISQIQGRCTLRCTLYSNLRNSLALIKAGKSSRYCGPGFWKMARDVAAFNSGKQFVLCSIADSYETNPNSVQNEIKRENGSTNLDAVPGDDIQLDEAEDRPLKVTHYRSSDYKSIHAQRRADVGILCVVADEMKAIREFLKPFPEYRRAEGLRTRRDFYEAQVPGENGSSHRVAVTRALEQGSRSIMPAYQALCEEYRPRLMVLLGVGGAIHPEAQACDTVIAEQIFYYDKRSETEQGPQHRLLAFRIESWLLRYINRLFDDHGDKVSLQSAQDSPQGSFRAHLGPIGTGEAVIKYRNAEVRQWLETVNDKTLALETEAAGVAQQFTEDTLHFAERAKGYLVIRGISDHADREKNDRWRIAASVNAMATLRELMARIPVGFE